MLLVIIGFLIVALYWYGTRNYDYWKKKGIPYEEPIIFVGSNLKQFIDKVSVSERFANLYRSYPHEKCVGFFEGNSPSLLLRDPQMINQVLVTDFRNFHYRGLLPDGKNPEILLKNIFTVDGDIWKLMRQKLTPVFTSGKLKAMFPLIIERTEKLLQIAEGLSETSNEIDVRDLMARYTTDFIGAYAFGIDSDALNEEDSDFRKLGKRVFNVTIRDQIVSLAKRMYPGLLKKLTYTPPEVERNTISIVRQVMSHRDYKPSRRNDFIDMMLELKQKEKIKGESLEHKNPDGTPMIVELEIDDLLLAAQVFVFFAAGFETSSHASSFLLHLLAINPDKQALCQNEIDEVLKRHDGKLNFEAVREMKYLEMCFNEAIRLLPSPGFLARRSVAKYTFPETNLTIDENVLIIISLDALHNDEKYFENPTEFWPERFQSDNISKFDKDVYMPFGDGPRACIGKRLGIMQVLAGVSKILSKFSVVPSRSTIQKPLIDPSSCLVQNIAGGLPLSLKLRE